MMDIKIYQVNMDRDRNGVCFLAYESLAKFQRFEGVDSYIYDKVYEGEVAANSMEDVYYIFNLHIPEGYEGRSLSVSDIVEVASSDCGIEAGYYFCDSIGFKKVEFDPEKVSEKKTITVVLVEPGKPAREAELNNTLHGLQNAVDGNIEVVRWLPGVCLICNEEGKIKAQMLNRAIYDEQSGDILDIIRGPFFICNSGEEEFASLNAKQIEKYTAMFRFPEKFLKTENGIVVILNGSFGSLMTLWAHWRMKAIWN